MHFGQLCNILHYESQNVDALPVNVICCFTILKIFLAFIVIILVSDQLRELRHLAIFQIDTG